MDKETVKQAVNLINVNGVKVKDAARQLGVSQRDLRAGIARYNEDFEECTVEVIEDIKESLGITAYQKLPEIFSAMKNKLRDPFTSLGELTAAARLFYEIYKKESDAGGNDDGNDPVSRLFGNELKTLNK